MVFCIVLEMHGFSHRFLILWENTVKAIPGRDYTVFKVWVLLFDQVSTLHPMRNAWIFL